MPRYVVQKVSDALNDARRPIKGSRLLLLGMAYKPEVDDTRESPSLEVLRQLRSRGGDVRYCDPWVGELELDGVHHLSVEWSPEQMLEADCVVLLTAHRQFLDQPLWKHARLIVDTRNVVPDGPGVKRI
jgi:UDP-N-acetyl-D-glucosamine dehydrogenase